MKPNATEPAQRTPVAGMREGGLGATFTTIEAEEGHTSVGEVRAATCG